MRLKPGVSLRSLCPQIVLALLVAESLWRGLGTELVVTSVSDGLHRRGSLHYAGAAADLRTHNLPHAVKESTRDRLWQALGSSEAWDVILEAVGTPNEHIHLEWQPKSPTLD